MSTYLTVRSICGDKTTSIDIYDLELNRDGVICCDNCESILICRKAWNFLMKGVK
jgi:hypothetical protein